MTTDDIQQPKVRLRVFRVIVEAFRYCIRDFGRLFVFTWFACVLASATRLLLEWLSYPWPRMPEWMLSSYFDPPTWLSFLMVPWLAMGWAFVLNEMFDENPRRGVVNAGGRELGWLRFEMGRTILIAAALLAAVTLIDGGTRLLQHQALVAISGVFELPERTLAICAVVFTVLRIAVMLAVFVWFYTIAGLGLHTGTFSIARTRQFMRGNWLRVAGIFFLLLIILRGIDLLLGPVTDWLIRSLTTDPEWTLQALLVRFVVDFPFQMLWILVWGVTIGIVLHTLKGTVATTAAEERAAATAGR